MYDEENVWIASYPRSGNTFIRTILWHCFELRTASLYPDDLGGNAELEKYVGHIEIGEKEEYVFPVNNIHLVKTHEHESDNNRAIYIIRDGRAACISLWKFFNETKSLTSIIEGDNQFGTWSAHVKSWNPWERPNTLLLRYEDVKADLNKTLEKLSGFLDREIVKNILPDRDLIADSGKHWTNREGGRWVNSESDWREVLTGKDLERFNEINKDCLIRAGYL